MDVSKYLRRRPRLNQKNKSQMEKVCWKRGKVHVWIPWIVDDYNHWMCGVYMADQKISYYHPDIIYHITWVPMFTLLLSIVRFNSYIRYVSHSLKTKNYKAVINHKYFLMEIVRNLLNKYKHYDANKQVKIEREEDKAETENSRPIKIWSRTVKEE